MGRILELGLAWFWLASAVLAASIAGERGGAVDGLALFVTGLFLGPLAIVGAFVFPGVRCIHCQRRVHPRAIRCDHCKQDLNPWRGATRPAAEDRPARVASEGESPRT
jgi:hypothetical protein